MREVTIGSSPSTSVPAVRSTLVWDDRVRWALLVCWVVLLGYCLGFSERTASWDELDDAVRSGRVDTVRVGPPGVPAGASGSGVQEVHWRDHLKRVRAEVEMVTSGAHDDGGSPDDDIVLRRGHDVAAQLRLLDPDLRVVRVGAGDLDGSQVYGWNVPPRVGVAAFVMILLTLALLIIGPRPRWATRWAWFWLMATPVGAVLFLLLAGPTPGMPVPGSARPRLRGGWALLIAALSASMLPTWWHSG